MKILILAASLALATPLAAAQTVWRCGNSYAQEPCAGGKSLTLSEPVTGQPMPAANIDAKLAGDLEKARLAQERNAPKAIIIAPVEAPPIPTSSRDGTKPKMGKLEQFTAVSPAPAKDKAKAKPKPKSKN
jgi:hypothetical protein